MRYHFKAHCDNKPVSKSDYSPYKIFNRRLNDRTLIHPLRIYDVKYCLPTNFVSKFFNVSSRDITHPKQRDPPIEQTAPIHRHLGHRYARGPKTEE